MPRTFDIDAARRAGYSDAQIAYFLAGEYKFDVQGAQAAGYSFEQIAARLAEGPPKKKVEAQAAQTTPVKETALEKIPFVGKPLAFLADIPMGLMKGVGAGFETIAGAAGAGTDTRKAIKDVQGMVDRYMSASSKKDAQKQATILKEAENKGVLHQVAAGINAFAVAPIDTLTQAFGTAAAPIGATAAATYAGAPAAVVTGAGVITGGLMGLGTAKNAIYDAVREEYIKAGVPEAKAEALADAAQAYSGKNLGQILLSGGLGAVSGVSGIEGALSRVVGQRVFGRLAAAEAGEAAAKGVGRRALGVAAKEGAPEFIQGAQEQLATNLALQREGFDVDTMRGVVSSGTLEGIAGAGLGAVAGATEGFGDRKLTRKAEAKARQVETDALRAGMPVEEAALEAEVARLRTAYNMKQEVAEAVARRNLAVATGEEAAGEPTTDTGVDDFGRVGAGTAPDLGTAPPVPGVADAGEAVGGGLERAVSGVSVPTEGTPTGERPLIEPTKEQVKATVPTIERAFTDAAIDFEDAYGVKKLNAEQKKQAARIVIQSPEVDPYDAIGSVLDRGLQLRGEVVPPRVSAAPTVEAIPAAKMAAPAAPPIDEVAVAPTKAAIKSVTTPAPDTGPVPSLAQASAQKLGITPTPEVATPEVATPEVATPEVATPEVAPLSREEKPIYDPADYTPQEIYDNLTRFGYKEAERRGYVFNTAENGMFGEGVREAKNPDIQPLTDEQVLSLERGSPEVLAAYKEGQQWGKEQVAAVQEPVQEEPVQEEATLEAAPVAEEVAPEAAPVAEEVAPEAAPVAEEVAPEVVAAPAEEAAPEADPYTGVLADIEAALADEAIDARTHKLLTSAVERRLPLEKIEAQLDVARTRSAERAMGASNSERATPSERLQGLIYRMQDAWKVLTGKPILANARLADLLRDPDILSKMNPAQRGLAAALADVIDDDVDVYIGNLNFSPQEAFTLGTATVYDGAAPDVRLRGVSTAANIVTLLHEAVHVALIAKFGSDFKRLTDLGPDADPEMLALRDEVYNLIDAYNTMFEAESSADLLLKASPYGMKNLDEFIAEGLTQPSFQKFLEKGNLWTRFVGLVRKMLKLQPKFQPQLDNVLKAGAKLIAASKNIDRMEDVGRTFEQRKKAAPKGKGSAQERVATGEAEETAKKAEKSDKKISRGLRKVQLSNAAQNFPDEDVREGTKSILDEGVGATIKGHTIADFIGGLKDNYNAIGDTMLKRILYALPADVIVAWKESEVPALRRIATLEDEARAERNAYLSGFAKISQRFAKFVGKNGQKVLGSTMHLARLNRVDPTAHDTVADALVNDPVVQRYEALIAAKGATPKQKAAFKGKLTQRRTQIEEVYDLWEALGAQENGHKQYIEIRDYYKDMLSITRTLLDEQIEALDIDPTSKKALLKAVRLEREKERAGKLELDDEFPDVDPAIFPEQYFPFKRYGDYWLRVGKGDAGREFYTFESARQRNKFLRKRARELGIPRTDDRFKFGNDITSLRENFQEESAMLQQIFSVINKASTQGKVDANTIKDQIYQVYLMTLPERSIRKQFLHADNVTGFSADVFRNFKTTAFQYANQIVGLRYTNRIKNTIEEAKDTLAGFPPDEAARLESFVVEIGERALDQINPEEPGRLVTAINRAAFVWFLTSAATAAAQTTAIPVRVMPRLWTDYGYGKATAMLAKYSKVWDSVGIVEEEDGELSYTGPTVGESQFVRSNPILKRAFAVARDERSVFETQVAGILDSRATPDRAAKYTPGQLAESTVNGMSVLFNTSERITREIAFMMAFELEYKKSKNFDEAVDKAVGIVNDTMGNYSDFNRPRLMKGDLGRALFLFKQYAVNTTAFFYNNFRRILTGGKTGFLSVEDRLKAANELTGVLLMGGLFHGITGFPLYSTIATIIDMLEADDDDEEAKLRRLRNPYTANNSDYRFRYEYMPSKFGEITIPGIDGSQHRLSDILVNGPISELSDINIGSRTTFDGLWFREGKQADTPTAAIANAIIANVPGLSLGAGLAEGVKDIINGDVNRGVEAILPAAFKGVATAYRLSEEGAETRGELPMLAKSEITPGQIAAQVSGFGSTKLAQIQKERSARNKLFTTADKQRTGLLRDLNEAMYNFETSGSQDRTDMNAAARKLVEYNKKHPVEPLVVTEETVQDSYDAFKRERDLQMRGSTFTKKEAPFAVPGIQAAAPEK